MSVKTIWNKLWNKLCRKTDAVVLPNEYFDMKGKPISLPTSESYIYHNPNTDIWYYAEISYLDMDRACIYHIYNHPITLEMKNGMMKIKKTDIHQLTAYPFINLDEIKSDRDKSNEFTIEIDVDITKTKAIEILKKELEPFLDNLFGDSYYEIKWIPIEHK